MVIEHQPHGSDALAQIIYVSNLESTRYRRALVVEPQEGTRVVTRASKIGLQHDKHFFSTIYERTIYTEL